MPERGSKTSTVPVVWATFEIFSARSKMISCRNRWPWTEPGYITMTWIQSNNQWSGGIAAYPAPKNSECKNPLEKFSPRFLGSGRHPTHWLSFKRPNYQRGVLLISAGAIEGHFEGEKPREGHRGYLVLARQCPGLPGTCNPEETGLPGLPVSWSPTLFSGSGPVGLPPVPWTEKTIVRSPFFFPTRRSLLPRRPGWTDKHLIFLSVLQTLEQRAKKYIELRGKFVEWIPSLVAVGCFLPGRTKDLSALPPTWTME